MKKGFTLIELLIASSIFVIVMVIATATFGWATAYNAKLRQMRMVSQDARRATEQISTDIRLANGSLSNFRISSSDTPSNTGEIVFFNCSNIIITGCVLNNASNGTQPTRLAYSGSDLVLPAIDKNANAILVLQQDQGRAVMYWTLLDNNGGYLLVSKSIGSADSPAGLFSSPNLLNAFRNPFYSGSDISAASPANGWVVMNTQGKNGDSMNVGFSGYGPSRSNRNQQPYVEFGIRAETYDYDKTDVVYRDRFDLRTTAETRDYK